mmetsp:Transcript_12343/g.21842  ORF Transcript_12343/g.21842 Transcript_12343/m.21842 type:complete len:248 (-) Transcript_12343:620-1363(-)
MLSLRDAAAVSDLSSGSGESSAGGSEALAAATAAASAARAACFAFDAANANVRALAGLLPSKICCSADSTGMKTMDSFLGLPWGHCKPCRAENVADPCSSDSIITTAWVLMLGIHMSTTVQVCWSSVLSWPSVKGRTKFSTRMAAVTGPVGTARFAAGTASCGGRALAAGMTSALEAGAAVRACTCDGLAVEPALSVSAMRGSSAAAFPSATVTFPSATAAFPSAPAAFPSATDALASAAAALRSRG